MEGSLELSASDRCVEVVIPAYNERIEALVEAIGAMRRQTRPVGRITVVDDCSPEPIPSDPLLTVGVRVIRLARNSGAAGARNAGFADSEAKYVAFVDAEVVPREDWVDICWRYLERNPRVGIVGTRIRQTDRHNLLGRWRALVQEPPVPERTGRVRWIAGHAMMFRADALRAAGWFNEGLRCANEDVEVCYRLERAGWETHYVADTECRSIQEDTISVLAGAEYNRFCSRAKTGNGLFRPVGILSGRSVLRLGLHLAKRRWDFLPVEAPVWLEGVRIAWRRR